MHLALGCFLRRVFPARPLTVPWEREAAGAATSSFQDALGPLLEKLPWGFQNCSPWGRVKEERGDLALPQPRGPPHCLLVFKTGMKSSSPTSLVQRILGTT